MAQHFLLSAAARSLSLRDVLRMEEAEAWRRVRQPPGRMNGAPVCPRCTSSVTAAAPAAPCGIAAVLAATIPPLTSGSVSPPEAAHRRLSRRRAAICKRRLKGKERFGAVARFGREHKTAFVLAHRSGEATAAELKGVRIGGACELPR